jgi:PAS domain S-box-containing protein
LAVEISNLPRLLLFSLLAFFVASLTAAQQSKAESLRRARDVLDGTVRELKRTNVALQAENAERRRAEEAVRRSEDHLRLVIDTIPTMAWSVRLDGTVDFLNQRWMDYTGLSLEQYVAEPTRPIHPEDVSRVIEKWLADIAVGEPYEAEMRLRQADGKYRWFLVRTAPLRDEQGNLVKWYGVAVDIEDRKRAEEKLMQSETQLAEAQHMAHVGSWNWDLQSKAVSWSDELYRIFGVDPKVFNPTYEGFVMEFVHPEDRALARGVVESSLKTQEPFSFYTRILRPDGEERVVHARGDIVSDEHGNPIRVFGTAEDVTERKQAEEALREAEQKYRDIFEKAGEGIFQSTPDGRYIAANPALARMYRFASPEELIHSRLDISRQIYVDPTRREEFKRQLEEHGAVRGFEHEVFRKDGSRLWISVNAHAVRDEQGAIQYYEGTAQDVTERKAAEEKLKANSEQLRALSARLQSAREEEGTRIAREIHDELGSALTSLKWDLEEIDKQLSTPLEPLALVALREKFQTPMKLADLAITAIRRIASELRPSVLDDLGLVAAIEWQGQQFQSRTGIVCVCDCSLEKVELNEEQSTAVFRILQEALTNVLRHSHATKVDIKINKEKGYFVLSVSDNGKGITESVKSEQQSLGILGMRERAHLIGGKIGIKGVEGEGTVVTVRVPISGQDRVLKMTR